MWRVSDLPFWRLCECWISQIFLHTLNWNKQWMQYHCDNSSVFWHCAIGFSNLAQSYEWLLYFTLLYTTVITLMNRPSLYLLNTLFNTSLFWNSLYYLAHTDFLKEFSIVLWVGSGHIHVQPHRLLLYNG